MLAAMEAVGPVNFAALHAPLEDDLRRAAARVLASGRFILGEEVRQLEDEVARLHGVKHAIGASSGTDALLLMLGAHGIGAGDDVVTSPFSFMATAEAISRVGARPVFADIDRDTLNLDGRAAARAVTGATKAVLVVHLFGRTADTTALRGVCGRLDIPILEDAAQAIGAAGVARERAAALSFFPTKNLGGFGDGGMVLTSDDALAAQARLLRNHGAAHEEKLRHLALGGNFRLDELQAALLRVKFPYLAPWTARRRSIAAGYRDLLAGCSGIRLPPPDPGCVWNQFVVRVPADRRTGIIAHLASRGIASAVYYPIPLHLQPALASLGYKPGAFPHAEQAAREVLALPIHPTLTDDDVARVAGAVADFFR